MQLMPQTAATLGVKDVLDAASNVEGGTKYLRQLLDQYQGDAVKALAAYNAGENRVTDWQSAGPYSGLDEFVESIPFTETRDYVQAIVRNIETYRAIDAFASTPRRVTTAER